MAKKSMVERNRKRLSLVAKQKQQRQDLKNVIHNRELPFDARIKAQRKISKLSRNGAANRLRNRCEVTGRPRGYYRHFRLSRIMIIKLGDSGMIPGLIKSSW